MLRTKRWLLENNAPYHFGTLFDCGDQSRRNAVTADVTDSTDPEVVAIKQRFADILATKPVPEIPQAQRPGAEKKNRHQKKKQNENRSR